MKIGVPSSSIAIDMCSISSLFCYYRAPIKNYPPATLETSSLLCPHGGFLYDPSLFDNGDLEK